MIIYFFACLGSSDSSSSESEENESSDDTDSESERANQLSKLQEQVIMVSKQLAALSKKGGSANPGINLETNLAPFLSKEKKRKKEKSSKKKSKSTPSSSAPLLPALTKKQK